MFHIRIQTIRNHNSERIMHCCVLGWSDFSERKKLGTCHVGPNCWRTAIPKFHFIMLLFSLAWKGKLRRTCWANFRFFEKYIWSAAMCQFSKVAGVKHSTLLCTKRPGAWHMGDIDWPQTWNLSCTKHKICIRNAPPAYSRLTTSKGAKHCRLF